VCVCVCVCYSEEGSSGRKLVGTSSGTQQSTATSKGSAGTEPSGKTPIVTFLLS